MCIGFIKLGKPGDRYKLIVLNNRDEDLNRETSKLNWNDEKTILGGTDQADECKGTWLAVNKYGKIGMLLSITQPKNQKMANCPSRGQICHQYLNNKSDLFFETLLKNSQIFNGFQFVGIEKNEKTGEYSEVLSLANKYVEDVEVIRNSDSIQVYSNSPKNIPFKKVLTGETIFEECLTDSENMEKYEIFENLVEQVARNKKRHLPDSQIQLQTGYSETMYAPLSSIFVEFPPGVNYGTRCHTVIIIDKFDKVTVFERRREIGKWLDEMKEFQIYN